jgi:hypothetical protein
VHDFLQTIIFVLLLNLFKLYVVTLKLLIDICLYHTIRVTNLQPLKFQDTRGSLIEDCLKFWSYCGRDKRVVCWGAIIVLLVSIIYCNSFSIVDMFHVFNLFNALVYYGNIYCV